MTPQEIQQFNQLPQDIQDILLSDIDNKLNDRLIKQYQIPDQQIKILTRIILYVFLSKIKIEDLSPVIAKNFGLDKYRAQDLAKDILGLRFLAFDKHYQGRVSAEMKRLGAVIQQYQEVLNLHSQTLQKIRNDRQAELAAEAEPERVVQPLEYQPMDPDKEKKESIEIFKSKLVNFLTVEDPAILMIIDDYNAILIELMDEDVNFRRQLEQALYANQEKLTSANLQTDDGIAEPTIANWLADFVAQKGTDYFDNVTLSDYVTASNNARSLSAEERKSLARLLELYRNLKFFPAGLDQIPPENWQIIPFSIDALAKAYQERMRPGQLSRLEAKALTES